MTLQKKQQQQQQQQQQHKTKQKQKQNIGDQQANTGIIYIAVLEGNPNIKIKLHGN